MTERVGSRIKPIVSAIDTFIKVLSGNTGQVETTECYGDRSQCGKKCPGSTTNLGINPLKRLSSFVRTFFKIIFGKKIRNLVVYTATILPIEKYQDGF